MIITMDTNPQRPIDAFVKRSMGALQKEYLVIGKTRVSRLTSWAVLAFFLGMTLTIGFLASRTGTFEQGEAARAPRAPKSVYSRWSRAQEGTCEGKTSATRQCRVTKLRKTVIQGGKRKIFTVQGFQLRSCTENCGAAAFSSSGNDIVALDFRYLRDYFTPQVTNLAFHREIKCKHFKEKNCTGVKLNYSGGGSIVSSSFTPSPYTASESIDQQNGIFIWQVPKTARTYWINFDSNLMAQEDINAFYQACPTDKSVRCLNKLQNGGYTSIGFSHNAGVSDTISAFGIQDDVLNTGTGSVLYGKYSVRFFGDEAGYVIGLPRDPATTLITTGIQIIFKFWNLLSDNLWRSGAAFNDIIGQTPVDTMFLKSIPADKAQGICIADLHVNDSQTSPRGQKVLQVMNDVTAATGGLLHFRVAKWDSGQTWLDVATQESESSISLLKEREIISSVHASHVCNKNDRCGENGTNDIVFADDMPYGLYKTLANETPGMTEAFTSIGLSSNEGVGAATNWYGFTGSKGNNDIAVILTEADIVMQTKGFDLSNSEHEKAFRMILAHELSHFFVGRGANEVFIFDDQGKPHMLSQSGSLTNSSFWGKITTSLLRTVHAKSEKLLTKEDLQKIYGGCTPESSKPQCSDGVDNDADTLIDYPNDEGCSSPDDIDEKDDIYHPLISVEQ